MNYAIVESATGKICIIGETHSQHIVDLKTVGGFHALYDIPADLDARVTYHDGFNYVPRPVIEAPSASYDLSLLPQGTSVTVWNEFGENLEVSDLNQTLILEDPGTYRFEIIPPFPYREIRTTVDVD